LDLERRKQNDGTGFFSFGFPGLGMLTFWGAIILLLLILLRGVSPDRDGSLSSSARDVLDQRYARGEIDIHEYEKLKQSLSL
jgi:putative membrane protein